MCECRLCVPKPPILLDQTASDRAGIPMKNANSVAGDFNTAITLDDAGMALGPGPGTGLAGPAESGHSRTPFSNDAVTYDPATGLFHDGGDTFPTAAGGGSASTSNGSSSPVASIPTLASWLTNGLW